MNHKLIEQNYFKKYLQYKQKYLNLINQKGGTQCLENNNGFHQKKSECWHDTLLMIILFSNFQENKTTFGDLDQEKFINPIQKNLLDDFFIFNKFIYLDKNYSSSFLLPINFNLDEKQTFDVPGFNYVDSIHERLINIIKSQKQLVTPTLTRQISFSTTFKSIEYVYEISNHNNYYLRKFKKRKNNYGDYNTSLTIINIFNYYFFKNEFINIYKINKKNSYYLDTLFTKNIIGVLITAHKINYTDNDISHIIALYKCNDKYFYYDNEGNLINNGVSIEFDWSDYNIFKDLDQLYCNINSLYINKDISNNYYFSSLDFLYMDDFRSEAEYIDKIKHNFIYYIKCYDNDRFNDYLESKFRYIYNDVDDKNNSFLIYSCKDGIYDYVELLLEYPDINIDNQNIFGFNALIYACESQNVEIVRLLLTRNINLNLFNNIGDTALIISYKYNNLEIFNLLLRYSNINIDHQNNEGFNALIYACEKQDTEIVRLLLEKNINIRLYNNDGDSALIITCRHNNLEIFNLLLPLINKTDILKKNKKYESALMLSKYKIKNKLHDIIYKL